KWTSDLGKEISLGVFSGRPVVLAMFFTHCEFACPIIVQDMKRIEEALPKELKGEVDFVLVSLDPDRDSVEALRSYRNKQGLSLENWALLRGPKDEVRELSALLGINYRKDERGQFAHSNLITVLNPKGEIIHQKQGLNQSVEDTIKFLK
ncbi:SCO family protein, partial [Verrucomicrobia bacterium]|nr:SCO family protein [Verrucomicrobiota bacterium]